MSAPATESAKPDTTYNGWTNYETWLVSLWIDNDEPSAGFWTEQTKGILADPSDAHGFIARGVFSRTEASIGELSRTLKDHFDEAQPDLGASFWTDLLSAALSEVNWREIAENMIEAVQS